LATASKWVLTDLTVSSVPRVKVTDHPQSGWFDENPSKGFVKRAEMEHKPLNVE